MHRDSGGHESIITAGGVQWMTAGSGLIHAEVSSPAFKEKGGDMEILQLWLNLPSKLKMTQPFYRGLQKDQIPEVFLAERNVVVKVISGSWNNTKGAFESLTGVHLNLIYFKPQTKLMTEVPVHHNIFFYVIRGSLTVNGVETKALHLVEFNNDVAELHITASADSILLLGHAEPLNEPVVAQGPFVMNTEEEIFQAYADYRQGKFGTWK